MKEIEEAVAAAVRAFPGWRRTPVSVRAETLRRIGSAIREHARDLASIEVLAVGTPISALEGMIGTRAPGYFDYYADLIETLHRRAYNGPGAVNEVQYAPAGVAALIVPWNAPLAAATLKLAAALAAGDTVVLKTPEWAPQSLSFLGRVLSTAGVPDGVVNVVHGLGPDAGAALVDHPDVARVSFTGSTRVGRMIAEAAGRRLAPVSLELGGKSPLVALPGADLDLAVDTITSQYFNAGQICYSATRLIVHESLVEELVDRLAATVSSLRLGDPRDPDTLLGPLITPQHLEQVQGFVDRAVIQGARCLYGGRGAQFGELYFEPTLLVDVRREMEIWREEVFGPVLVLTSFSHTEDALRKANDTSYGLAAVVVGPEEAAAAVGQEIDAGLIWINCSMIRSIEQPYGGCRDSGIGREGGHWGLEFFSNVKNLCAVRPA